MSDTSAAYNPAQHNIQRVSRVRLFIRALGISIFSLVSLLMAFYAFLELPQVQDLFFDARPYWFQEAIYWTGFYATGIFLWALPLVFASRLLILQNFDVIGIDTEDRFKFYVFRLPSFYVVLAFAAVFIGIIVAAQSLPAPSKDGGNAAEIPIRNFLETHLITLLVATGAVLVLVLVRDLFIRGYGEWMQYRERKDPEGFRKTLIRVERLTRKAPANIESFDLHLTELKPPFLSTETWIAAQRVKAFMWRYLSGLTYVLLVLVAIHFLSYSDLVQRWLTLPELSSQWLQDALDFVADTLYLKRASFLFVIFGAWLPFLTILALLSNRYQFPYIATLIAAGVGLTLFIGDGHDIRIVEVPKAEQRGLKPVAFADAVTNWKAANGWTAKGCDQLPTDSPQFAACPRPIIVAGEGGGSRAAFLLASVLGSLEDESVDQSKRDPSARIFHNQVFAISSVSGSAVGAAFFVSAIKTHPNPNLADLKKGLYRQRLWFLNIGNAKTNHRFLGDYVTYKDALQAALSNDFISPDLIAYLARDTLTLSRLPFVMDRAGVLETAWEDAFDDVFGVSREASPLAAPIQTITPTDNAWLPLLFLNATSIETGRRVVATPVKVADPLSDGNALLIDAYDLHEILCSPYPGQTGATRTLDQIARFLPAMFSPDANADCVSKKPVSIDVRLSTAAGASSRSPFVSPHANLRDRTAQIADSVVDGGYFDNSGAVTALEIATGIKTVDPRLQPFILEVSSEPDWFKDTRSCGANSGVIDRPQIPDEPDFRPIGTVTDLLTVNSTRVSRGFETILELPRQSRQINGGVRSEAQIFICPQRKESFIWEKILNLTNKDKQVMAEKRELRIERKTQEQSAIGYKSVSLSWWLSPPLQAFLDAQVYSTHNRNDRACMLSLLRDPKAGEVSACQQEAAKAAR